MIGRVSSFGKRLLACQSGAMAVETAILAPALVTLTIGVVEVGQIVARQTELQTAAAEAAAVVRANVPETSAERTTIRDIIATSTGLSSTQVSVVQVYRCGYYDRYVSAAWLCAFFDDYDENDETNTYIRVTMTDTYTPLWTEFGFGNALTFNVRRTILVG